MASAVINQVSCPSLGLTRAAGYLNESASDRKISFTMARLLCPAIRKVTCAAALMTGKVSVRRWALSLST